MTTPPRASAISAAGRDDEHDLKVRAAWLYHIEGLTQARVADAIGISRAKTARLLAAARDEGVVSVRIDARAAERIALERRLIARFGLDDAIVAPGAADDAGVAEQVGAAAATFLRGRARDGMALGVGWGATLSAAARALVPLPLQGASVISLLGGMTHSRGVNPSAVARRLADAFTADCFQLTAPLVVAEVAVRDALWSEPALQALRARVRRADLALVSVGQIDAQATLFREGLLAADLLPSLLAAGAVGDCLGRFVDADGGAVAHPVNDRIVAVDMADLASVRCLAIASGGAAKVPALRAVLTGLRVHVLATDESAARGLLEH